MLAAQEVNVSLISSVCSFVRFSVSFFIICVCKKETKPTMQLKIIYIFNRFIILTYILTCQWLRELRDSLC